VDQSVSKPVHARPIRRAPRPPALVLRRLHGWLGAFFAPTLLFFAASGALQVYDLHKSQPGGGSEAPSVLVAMGRLHKDQELPRRPTAPAPKAVAPPPKPMSLGQTLLKAFTAAAAAMLALTTCIGLYLTLRSPRDRFWAAALFGLGLVAPIALLLLG
jgi:hypothetical protein